MVARSGRAQDFYHYLLFQPTASPDFKVMDYDFDKDPSAWVFRIHRQCGDVQSGHR
jgi:hypothetical protein